MSGKTTPGVPPSENPADKRAYARWAFKGTGFPVRMGKKQFEIRLKDLSCGGACGLMEEPVAIGDYILIEFDERHIVEAQVLWVRRVMVGLTFDRPLTPAFVSSVHERAAERPVADEAPVMRTVVRRINVGG